MNLLKRILCLLFVAQANENCHQKSILDIFPTVETKIIHLHRLCQNIQLNESMNENAESSSMHLTNKMFAKSNAFLYFAYGSNLLTERIRINNPSAQKVAIAKLAGWRLDFNLYGKSWHGAAATIVPETENHVWGVVWEIDNRDMPNLDRQEYGYDVLSVEVESEDGTKYVCRSYIVNSPFVGDRRPSTVYKNVIIKGAIEHQLPQDYINKLHQIEDNGYDGPVGINISLDSLRNG